MTGKNLDFATIDEVKAKVQTYIDALGVSVLEPTCYTMDYDTMREVYDGRTALETYDADFDFVIEPTKEDEQYVLEYPLAVNGMPFGSFDGGSYSDNVFTPGTYLTAVLDEDGIRHFDVSYVLKETETGDAQRVLTLDEALDKVDEKYNSIIMEGDYYINDIQMAYMPIKTDDAGIVRLIPVWYFQTTHQILLPDKSGTGEIMLPQDGYILINALDGTELLHENGDI